MVGRQETSKRASASTGSKDGRAVVFSVSDVLVGEPSFEDLLTSDVTRMVMDCDGVKDEQLRTLLGQVRSRLL